MTAQQNAGNQTVVWTVHELWCAWTRFQIVIYNLSVLYSYCNSFFVCDVPAEFGLINAHLFDISCNFVWRSRRKVRDFFLWVTRLNVAAFAVEGPGWSRLHYGLDPSRSPAAILSRRIMRTRQMRTSDLDRTSWIYRRPRCEAVFVDCLFTYPRNNRLKNKLISHNHHHLFAPIWL